MERPQPNPENPANNPEFVFELLERMEADDAVRAAVWEAFEDGDLTFLFHDAQLDMLAMVERGGSEILIFCSRQLGKSFFILCVAIMHCTRHPRGLVRIFCKTVDQANDIVADNMAVIQALAPPGFIKRMKSERRWRVGRGQIRIGPLAAAHVDGKRGGNATLVILEEGGFTPSEQYQHAIGKVIGPQLLRSGGPLVHVTTPSEDELHYVHTVVLPKCERTGALARKTVYENPQLTDEQIVQARDLCPTPEDWEREYEVKIKRSEMATITPEFDPERHVREMAIPLFAYWQTSLDFGGVQDKHGVILTYFDFDRAKLCVVDERFLELNTPTDTIVAESLEMERHAKWMNGTPWRVSDAPGQIVVDLRHAGFHVRTPEKGDGSWEAGIKALRGALRRGEVEIHPRCKWLIASLYHGRFNKRRTDFERTKLFGHWDLGSALIYAWRHRGTQNPWPNHLGKRPETHFVPSGSSSPASALSGAFLPDFLK